MTNRSWWQDDFEPDETLTPRTFERFSLFLSALYTVIVEIDGFDFSEEQKSIAREKLLTLDDHAHFLEALFREMEKSLVLLERQRQTAKTAFKAGWEGFYYELMLRLTREQREQFKLLFDEMNGDNLS